MRNLQKVMLVLLVIVFLTGSLMACSTQPSASSSSTAQTSQSAAQSVSASAEQSSAAPADSSAAPSSGKQLKFGFSVAILDNPYFIEVANGFKEECKAKGIEANVTDAKYDATEQYNQMENFITMGVDGICVAPVDAKSLEAVVKKAQDKGIKVVSEAQGVANADANVIVDDYKYGVVNGENASKWIKEKLGGKAKVLILSLNNVEAVILRGNGMQDTIKKNCPDAQIVARQMATTIEEAMKATETVLQAHPDLNVIACVNDQLALGAYQAVKNMNIKTENFFIGGADNTAEMIAKMKEEGSLLRSTIDIDPKGTGKNCVDVMLNNVTNGSEKGKNYFFDMKPVWQADLK